MSWQINLRQIEACKAVIESIRAPSSRNAIPA